MFEIIAQDVSRLQKVRLTRSELTDLVTDSLWQGALASCAIENINTDGIEKPKGLQLPDALLKI